MKILLASIIIGLLSLSPAFAESHMDKQQKETDQDSRYEQTEEGRQVNETDENRRSEQNGMPGRMDKQQQETDENRYSEQNGEQSQVMPRSDEERQGATDQDSRYGQTEEGRQDATDPARTQRAKEVEPQEGYQRVTADLITADDLQGASVYGSNNESMADVDEVLITPEGKVERAVVNVGGFLGMGGRSIAIDVNEADIHKDADNNVRVYIPMSKEEMRQMPEYKKDN